MKRVLFDKKDLDKWSNLLMNNSKNKIIIKAVFSGKTGVVIFDLDKFILTTKQNSQNFLTLNEALMRFVNTDGRRGYFVDSKGKRSYLEEKKDSVIYISI